MATIKLSTNQAAYPVGFKPKIIEHPSLKEPERLLTVEDFRYTPTNSEKQPVLWPEWAEVGGWPWNKVKHFDNVAMLVPKGYVVLDFDEAADKDAALRIIEGLGIKCRIVKTRRGFHAYFKENVPMEQGNDRLLHVGISADIKAGTNALAQVKLNGEMREVVQDIPILDCPNIPKWFEEGTNKTPRFLDMREGDGRNSALSDYLWPMQRAGLSVEECKEAARVINEYVFRDPFTKTDLERIIREKTFLTEKELFADQFFGDKGEFLHHKLALYIIDELHVFVRGNMIYIYDKDRGYYREDEGDIESIIIKVHPTSKDAPRQEVIKYIKAATTKPYQETELTKQEAYTINCLNGRLNLVTGELFPHSPEAMDFQQIPVKYDPSAKCPWIDSRLDLLFEGDQELNDLYNQIAGYALARTAEFDRFFIFHGEGSNGKSTMADVIGAMCGAQNRRGVTPQQLETDKFKAAELHNALVNIGDDIGAFRVKDTSILKKMVSGEPMEVERKFRDPFTMTPYVTFIYTANDIPRFSDNSLGFKRRMVVLPFTYTFKTDDPNYDPAIGRKMTTPEELSGLLNRAVKGVQQLHQNRGFIIPQKAKEATEKHFKESSEIMLWAEDRGVDNEWFKGKSQLEVYQDYEQFCTESGIKYVMSKYKFGRELKRELKVERKPRRSPQDGTMIWEWKIPDDCNKNEG